MEKKTLILIALILCLSFGFSASTIESYKVLDSVPLDQFVTATGYYSDVNSLSASRLCSFYLLDENSVLVDRADDQYTDSLGNFAMRFQISEPYFKRGFTYKVKTVCGNATATNDFNITQRESIAHAGSQEFEFLTNPQNTDTVLIWGSLIGLIIIIIVIIVSVISMKVR